jgi:hypothetical protein
MIGRLSLAFVVVSVAAFFCAQSVDAAKGPRITNKVFFDIKHGDESLGRSAYHFVSMRFLFKAQSSRYGALWRGKCLCNCYAVLAIDTKF